MGNKKSSKVNIENYDFETLNDIGDLNKNCNFGIIPIIVLHNIFLFTPLYSHLHMCLTCKFFNTVGNTRYFWEQFTLNTFRDNREISRDEAEKIGWKRYFFNLVNILQKENPRGKYKIINKNVFSTLNGKWVIGKHILTGEKVAIKIMNVVDEALLKNLKNEVDMHSKYHHENITTFKESFHHKKELWIVVEVMESQMTKLLLKTTITNENYIATILKKVLLVLEYLHENRCVHRDIKSDIILIGGDGSLKIADFELSHQHKHSGDKCFEIIGTPYWMAPEVIGNDGYSYKADVWSLGILLIELTDGEPPNLNLPPIEAMKVIVLNSPPPSVQNEGRWSGELISFLKRCLEKDVEKRADVKELLSHSFIEKAQESTDFLVTYLERFNLWFTR